MAMRSGGTAVAGRSAASQADRRRRTGTRSAGCQLIAIDEVGTGPGTGQPHRTDGVDQVPVLGPRARAVEQPVEAGAQGCQRVRNGQAARLRTGRHFVRAF